AHSGVADCHAVMAILGFRNGREAYPLAKAAAERALALDPMLAEAHHSVGTVRWLEWDWQAALISVGRAVELNPRLAISWVYRDLFLTTSGLRHDTIAEMRKAMDLE